MNPGECRYGEPRRTEPGKNTQLLLAQIGGYSEKLCFAVSPLRHQQILGKQWLASLRADLDCSTNKVVVKHRYKEYRFFADEPKESEQVSVKSITNQHRKMFPFFAVILRTNDLAVDFTYEAIPEQVRGVLNDYQEVF